MEDFKCFLAVMFIFVPLILGYALPINYAVRLFADHQRCRDEFNVPRCERIETKYYDHVTIKETEIFN